MKSGNFTEAWSDLVREFDRWAEAGRIATFWWRDDDAVEASTALDRLLDTRESCPLNLAVIPGRLNPSLANRIQGLAGISIMQHGWLHESHARPPDYSEYPAHRSPEDIRWETLRGRQILIETFGAQALATFVPPFNTIADQALTAVAEAGLCGLSRARPRSRPFPVPGLKEVNIHVALWRWDDHRFVGTFHALKRITMHLRGRREGRYDIDEPTGILTHHLVEIDESYAFIRQLLAISRSHPAAAWLEGGEIWPPQDSFG